MESVDVRVLRDARDWLAQGHRVMLVTVVKTWGSSPRPTGSLMALRGDGRCTGSVSGGCIEDDLVHRYTTAYGNGSMPASGPQLARYGITADEAHRFGLPCGGSLELLLEFHPEHSELDALVQRLQAGQLVQRKVDCATGVASHSPAWAPELLRYDGHFLCITIGPQYRMLLIGAGALSEYVATMALFNDFAVTVCDPRQEHMRSWSVPNVALTHEMPDDAVRALAPDARTCVIALSHDPKLDDMALLEALHSPAFFVGAIGSRTNTHKRRQRLMEHFDVQPQVIDRLHAPVGLYIGSKTPAEIAVSVMAQVLAIKNGVYASACVSGEQGKLQSSAAATVTEDLTD